MKFFVTGCSGFIGSTLVDSLISDGHVVLGLDNLSTGKEEFLDNVKTNENFTLIKDDIKNVNNYSEKIVNTDAVFHLAANADVRFGFEHPSKDIEQNTINTFLLLETMRKCAIKNILFASTGSVYGEAAIIPTPENCPFPVQTSLYGASKVAAEAFISAYCEGYKFNGVICRFVSLMGPRYTHGHVVDFVKSLKHDPKILKILGDRSQDKSYFHVNDCVTAMKLLANKMISNTINGFYPINLGTDEAITVKESAKIICHSLGLNPKFEYTGGRQGWIGDNPVIKLDIKKAREIGWHPTYTIKESIKDTALWVSNNFCY